MKIFLVVFLLSIPAYADNLVVVNLKSHTWSVYSNRSLIKKGVAIGGRKRCPEDGSMNCYTPAGEWNVIAKYGKNYRSGLYPIECDNKKRCGIKIPYYIRFHYNGTGIHAGTLPRVARNISHGCVRVSMADAKWLSEFLSVGDRVVVEKY